MDVSSVVSLKSVFISVIVLRGIPAMLYVVDKSFYW